MNIKHIEDAIEFIKDCLEMNDQPITEVYECLISFLEMNVEEILDTFSDPE